VAGVLLRLPFLDAPLTTDEGGYGAVARAWAGGAALYDQIWVDRPQGLLLVFRGVLHVDGGSVEAMRLVASLVASLVAATTVLVALRMSGRIAAAAAAGLAVTALASPFVEGFTLAGELIAALPAALAVLALVAWERTRALRYLAIAGLLVGAAFMVKQSAVDAGVAGALLVAVRERRRAVVPLATLVGAAAVPPALGAAAARDAGDWWYAVVGYRGEGDSLLSGDFGARMDLLWHSLPAPALALAAAAVLAAYGWRAAPLLARLWLGAALVGVAGGGNFHHHYYLQLVPPLAVLGGIGAAQLARTREPRFAAAAGALFAGGVLAAVPLWPLAPAEQARTVFPDDPHLALDAPVAAYLRAHTAPGDRVLVIWAAASVVYLADREPAAPYLWYRNVEAVPGALATTRRALARGVPSLVAVLHPPGAIDDSGATERILARRYRPVARVAGVAVYAPVGPAQTASTSAAASSIRAGTLATSIHSSGV
jgi:4-amino-4-deoxy-L-arabinose transferase-like glycosyltransferase